MVILQRRPVVVPNCQRVEGGHQEVVGDTGVSVVVDNLYIAPQGASLPQHSSVQQGVQQGASLRQHSSVQQGSVTR